MDRAFSRPISALPPATPIARLCKCLANSRNITDALRNAELMPEVPQVKAVLELLTKSSVPAMAIGGTVGNGAAFAQAYMTQEYLRLLRDAVAIEALLPRCRRIPPLAAVPRDSSTSSMGGVVAEGANVPALALTTDTVSLTPLRLAALTVLSAELTRLNAETDNFILAALTGGLGEAEDKAAFDPTRSTALTYGVGQTASTGSTASAQQTDFGSLIAAITTKLTDPVFIMGRRTAANVMIAQGAGAASLPTKLFGIPTIVSANLSNSSASPTEHLVILVDAAEVFYVDAGYELSASREAAIEMSDAPSGSGVTPTAAQMVSLWQNNLSGFLQTRRVNWSARSGAVSWMSVSY
jgi:HK97 family phage major capsid protein